MFWVSFQELKIMIGRVCDIFCDWPEMGGSCCFNLYDDLQNNYECPFAVVVGEVGLGDGAPQGPNQNPHVLGSWQIPISLNLSSPGKPSHVSLPVTFSVWNVAFIFHIVRVTCFSHLLSSLFDYPNNIWRRTEVMKRLFYPLIAPFFLGAHIRPITLVNRQP